MLNTRHLFQRQFRGSHNCLARSRCHWHSVLSNACRRVRWITLTVSSWSSSAKVSTTRLQKDPTCGSEARLLPISSVLTPRKRAVSSHVKEAPMNRRVMCASFGIHGPPSTASWSMLQNTMRLDDNALRVERWPAPKHRHCASPLCARGRFHDKRRIRMDRSGPCCGRTLSLPEAATRRGPSTSSRVGIGRKIQR